MSLSASYAEKRVDEEKLDAPFSTYTESGTSRGFSFQTLTEALDHAARGQSGLNFYSDRLELASVLSYRDLRESALSLARRFRSCGLRLGDRVALVADTTPDFVIAFAACQYGGLIPVALPLPLAFGGRSGYAMHVHHMMEGADVSAVIAPDWVMPLLRDAVEGLNLAFYGTMEKLRNAPETPMDLHLVHPEALSYLQFSSGSTRSPTPIGITHRALMSNTRAIVTDGLEVRAGDRAVSWLPFYHDMGLVGFLLAPIVAQLSVDYLATRDFVRRPLTWLRLIDRNHGTISYSPSFGYELCAKRVANGQTERLDLSSWRVAGIGGDMIRSRPLEAFKRAFAGSGFKAESFVPSYGLAETTLAVSFCGLGRGIRIDRVDRGHLERERRAVPAGDGNTDAHEFVVCGSVLPDHKVQIRDEEGHPLGERRVGKIFVRGPSLMTSVNHPAADIAATLDTGGWLNTGDLGYFVDGELVITGRAKDVIIINGRNLWPQDLEYSVEQVPGVRPGDVAAFGVESQETHEERVVVLLQCRIADSALRHELVRNVTASLSKNHGVSATVVPVPHNALPMTSSGKLRRRDARKAYLAGEFGSEAAQ